MDTADSIAPYNKIIAIIGHVVFWILNSIYIAGITWWLTADIGVSSYIAGILNQFLTEYSMRCALQLVAISLIISTPALALLPYSKWLQSPLIRSRVWQLIFGFEVLQVLLASLLVMLLEYTYNPGLMILFSTVLTVPLWYLWKLTTLTREDNRKQFVVSNYIFVLIATAVTSYFFILGAFFLPLVIKIVFDAVIPSGPQSNILMHRLLISIGSFLLLITAALSLVTSLWRSYRASLKQLYTVTSRPVVGIISFFVLVLLWSSIIVGTQPPSEAYISAVNSYNTLSTFAERTQLVQELRAKKNAVEASFIYYSRYGMYYPLRKDQDYHSLADQYIDELGVPDAVAYGINALFQVLAYPFFDPSTTPQDRHLKLTGMPANTRNAYYEIFGHTPGQRRNRIPSQSIGFDVAVVERTITAQTTDTPQLVTVTVTEEYKNPMSDDAEVIYEFYLPESSVITDLKLGEKLEYQGQIAPRGAAEQVYREQVRRRVDPALLEQTGPSQYRLRIFPIPGRNSTQQFTQRVSFTYLALLNPQGIPVPRYTTESNIEYRHTRFPQPTLDGKPVKYSDDKNWLISPLSMCAQMLSADLRANSTLLPSTSIVSLNTCNTTEWRPEWNLRDKRIALILSVSNRNNERETLDKLRTFFQENQSLLQTNEVVLYRYNTSLDEGVKVTPQNWKNAVASLVFFGTENHSELFSALPSGYDQLVIIPNTEEETAHFFAVSNVVPPIDDTVYITYLDGAPPALDQKTANFLRENDVQYADSIEEAILAHEVSTMLPETAIQLGPYWVYQRPSLNLQFPGFVLNEISSETTVLQQLLTAELVPYWLNLPALQNIVAENDETAEGNNASELRVIDFLHNASKRMGVVTPYSSYIALVNALQQERLEELSAELDRYESELGTTVFSTPELLQRDAVGFAQDSTQFVAANTNLMPELSLSAIQRVRIALLVVCIGTGIAFVFAIVRSRIKRN